MDFKIFADSLRDVSAKYRLLIIANVVLVVMLVALAIHNVYVAQRAKIIIVPTHLAAQVELEGGRASPEYIRIMLLHMTNLLYTYTPYNITDNYREFMAYVPGERWIDVKEQLQKRIDQIAKLKISETFISREVVLLESGVCVVAGRTIRWSAGQELATDDLYLRYQYQIRDGGFQIEEISLLSSGEYNALRRADRK